MPNGFQPLFRKNGILSFLRCEDHSAESPGSIAKKKCASRLCSHMFHIFIYNTLTLHSVSSALNKLVVLDVGSNYEESCMCHGACLFVCGGVCMCMPVCAGVCLCLHILPFPDFVNLHFPL